jgi:CspA family cold shock protein
MMINGTVKFYNTEQRFGYIKPEGETREIHFLANAFKKAGITILAEGQKVRFDTHTDTESGKLTVSHIEFD